MVLLAFLLCLDLQSYLSAFRACRSSELISETRIGGRWERIVGGSGDIMRGTHAGYVVV